MKGLLKKLSLGLSKAQVCSIAVDVVVCIAVDVLAAVIENKVGKGDENED